MPLKDRFSIAGALQMLGVIGAIIAVCAALLNGALQELLATIEFVIIAMAAIVSLVYAAKTHAD